MQRPPLVFLSPSLRHSVSNGSLLRPLRPHHHFTFPPPTRPSPSFLPQHPHHRLPHRHITTPTTTPTTRTSHYLLRLRRLVPSIPTLTILALSYILYTVTYTLAPVTGDSMSPLLNPSYLPPPSPPQSRWRRDWVWVEMWPSRLIRFSDPALNPSSPSSEAEQKQPPKPIIPWRKLRLPSGKRRYDTSRGLVRRGLVVVLHSPTSAAGESRWLVKRVIALPGDVVMPRPGAGYPRSRVLVPEGCVWVEGDNEVGERSWDSNNYGPVGVGMLFGRVGGRLWPLGRWGRLEEGEGEGEAGSWPGKERVIEAGGRRVRRWSGDGDGDELGGGDVA